MHNWFYAEIFLCLKKTSPLHKGHKDFPIFSSRSFKVMHFTFEPSKLLELVFANCAI